AADAHAVWRKTTEDGLWKVVISRGLSENYERTASQEGLSALQIPTEPIGIEDVEAFPLVQHRARFYRAESIRSMLTVPLRIHGEIGGTIVFYKRVPHRF